MSHHLALVIFLSALLASAALRAADPPKPLVPNKVPDQLRPFAWNEVTLLPGPLRSAFETNARYLKTLAPDRLLWSFRKTAGLPTPGQPYGGWEAADCELRGHFVGHYLSACARIYAVTGDAELKKNADGVVAELAKCQAKYGNGYLSAYPADFFDRLERFERVWAPYYTIHKIMLGLWEMHAYAGNAQALEVLKGMADYFKGRCDKLDDEHMQKMLRNEFGGMQEVLLNLHAYTGEKKYFDLAQRFVDRSFNEPLLAGRDALPGRHANTQLPKIAGAARAYELTGAADQRKIVEFFWDTLVTAHTYATGGSNVGEAWGEPHKLAHTLDATNQEFCTSYNFQKICRALLRWTGDARYGDMLERLFYNGILVSQHPQTGMLIYYLPFRTGLHKDHGTPFDTFTCCYGTGVQEYASLAANIFFHTDDALYVNLYANAAVTWQSPAGAVQVTQQTDFPDRDTTRISFKMPKPAAFKLALRVPAWATRGFDARVNGAPQSDATAAKPGSWLTLARTWQDGDTVEFMLPMTLRAVPMNDDPTLAALLYGPVTLAGLVDGRKMQMGHPAPVFTGDLNKLEGWIKPVASKPLTFQTTGQLADVTLIPIHKVVEENYGLYWRFAPPESAAVKEFHAAVERVKAWEQRAIDWVAIGDETSEKEHGLQGKNTASGSHFAGIWRHSIGPDSFFSYRLKLDPARENVIAVTYWGSDSGARTFDVLLDGAKLATQTLNNNKPNELFVVEYAVPRELAAGKSAAELRFQPSGTGQIAGGIFGLATLRAK